MKPDDLSRLEAIFREVLALPVDADFKKVRQLNQAAWDSLGHVTLMAAIEGEFAIALDTSEMLELTSFEAVRLFLEGKGL
jgi:acyl carrier protein